jgi:hypothetical protein
MAAATNNIQLRVTTAGALPVVEPLALDEAEQRFITEREAQWPTAGSTQPAVAVEVMLDTGAKTLPVRRSWLWASQQFTFIWDGDMHVGISQADPQFDEALEAEDRFPLDGPPPADLDGFVALCKQWERTHRDWVDHLLGRQQLMPRAYRQHSYDPQRDLDSGISAGHANSFRGRAREAASVLEELGWLLRYEPVNVIASYRAWAVDATQLLLDVALHAETLRSAASRRSHLPNAS